MSEKSAISTALTASADGRPRRYVGPDLRRPAAVRRVVTGGYSRSAEVISSVTAAELSLAGSTVGAWRFSRGTSAGFEDTSEPTAYSKEVPFCRTSCPALPMMNRSSDWAAAAFFDDLSTPPPETDTKAPGSWFLK